MKILLIKPETVGIFSFTYMIEHEPLEMEYLDTAFRQNQYETCIYDRRYDLTPLKKKLKQEKPDVVCITGYITQQALMIRLTSVIKEWNPGTKVILGGSNVEINYENYYDSKADFLYHLSGLTNLVKLMDYISGRDKEITLKEIPGICYRAELEAKSKNESDSKSGRKKEENSEWICNPKITETPADLPIPNRDFFHANKMRFRYMTFHPLALVKNSYSCRKACSFCFCTNRNSGKYACRSVESLVEEIKSLDVPNIHITDDDFLIDREYLKEFIRLIKENEIHKKYLIYGRADFIAANEDIIKEFAEIGLSLIMVGLEATNDGDLDSYHKKTTVEDNENCVKILAKYNVICAGLFIVKQDMDKKDFNALYEWIKARPIMPTISVFTPMQGSAMYKEYEKELLTYDVRKQDLFHCILKPEHMSQGAFTRQYYKLSLKLAWVRRKTELYSCVKFFPTIGYIVKVLIIKGRRWIVL